MSVEIPAELRTFIDDGGRMRRIPARRSKQEIMGRWLAGDFELGRSYSEVEVNAILMARVDDYVSARRLLIVMRLLVRDPYGKAYELASVGILPSP
jgi:hypothetical protein